jgi:hypothetical protein
MKKLWVLVIAAGALGACNGSSKEGHSDSTSVMAAPSDSTGATKDTSSMKTDSMVKNAPDTLKAH